MGDCISCEHHDIITDNHGKLEWICVCRESENFFEMLDGDGSCEHFEKED